MGFTTFLPLKKWVQQFRIIRPVKTNLSSSPLLHPVTMPALLLTHCRGADTWASFIPGPQQRARDGAPRRAAGQATRPPSSTAPGTVLSPPNARRPCSGCWTTIASCCGMPLDCHLSTILAASPILLRAHRLAAWVKHRRQALCHASHWKAPVVDPVRWESMEERGRPSWSFFDSDCHLSTILAASPILLHAHRLAAWVKHRRQALLREPSSPVIFLLLKSKLKLLWPILLSNLQTILQTGSISNG
jgi:hypothetical protein